MYSKLVPFLLTLGLSSAAFAAAPTTSRSASGRVAKASAKPSARARAGVKKTPTKTQPRARASARRPARGEASRASHTTRAKGQVKGSSRGVALKDDRFTAVKLRMWRSGQESRGPLTVYINGGGAKIQSGHEDAAANRSSIAWSQGRDVVNVPAFRGGAARWGSMMTCVRQQLAGYELRVTDERPEQGDYIMMMVGGRPGMLGYGDSVGGVAPYTGAVLRGTVGFVFADVIGSGREMCETVAHEIGHTLGLDHTFECTDTMSYLEGCGAKSFQDQRMRCGEWDARMCSNGQTHQNSHDRLARLVGLRPQTPAQPPARPPAQPKPPAPPPASPQDASAPRVSITSPRNGGSYDYGAILVIEFTARDESELASVELLWQVNGQTTAFRCGELPDDRPIECGRLGDEFVFALQVGAGARRYAIRATDSAGNVSTTRWRRATFAAPEPSPWDQRGWGGRSSWDADDDADCR